MYSKFREAHGVGRRGRTHQVNLGTTNTKQGSHPFHLFPSVSFPTPAPQGGQAAGGGRGEQACVGRALRGVSAGVPGHLLVAGGGAGGARGVVLQPPSAGRGGRFGGQSEILDVFVGFQKLVGDLEASRRF